MTHINTLHHTATRCITLQHAASHCNTLHHTATHYSTLQHTATHLFPWYFWNWFIFHLLSNRTCFWRLCWDPACLRDVVTKSIGKKCMKVIQLNIGIAEREPPRTYLIYPTCHVVIEQISYLMYCNCHVVMLASPSEGHLERISCMVLVMSSWHVVILVSRNERM